MMMRLAIINQREDLAERIPINILLQPGAIDHDRVHLD
jgi:hypothetical protein